MNFKNITKNNLPFIEIVNFLNCFIDLLKKLINLYCQNATDIDLNFLFETLLNNE